jgi:hypothetical protein
MWCGLLVRKSSSSEAGTGTPIAAPVRAEICPPGPVALPPGRLGRFLRAVGDWLGEGFARSGAAGQAAADAAGPGHLGLLGVVRLEFVACLDDIPTRQAAGLIARIEQTRSLRELWHLRADVFSVVSCHCDQTEAGERVARLNRHFPTRALRSGFGGFDVLLDAQPKRR